MTAMMSLFIVLWLMNSSKPIQDAVGGYFRDPHGTADKKGTAFGGSGDADVAKKEDMSKLQDQILASLQRMPDFEELKKHIDLSVTPEGLRIELLEDAKGTFFESGKAEPTPSLIELLKVLSTNIGILPNKVSIEGHTDSKPYAGASVYSNWELSSDRANMARRLMEANGMKPGTGLAGAWLCRPTLTETRAAARCLEPQGVGDRAVHSETGQATGHPL